MSEDEPFRYYDDDGNLHPDYVSCPTCNGQGYRDEYSGDPEHGGETCYHCYGHGIVHRTEEENRPIDDIMRDMANDPTKENAQAVRDYFTPKPEMEYDDDFQQKLTGSPMDLAFRLLKTDNYREAAGAIIRDPEGKVLLMRRSPLETSMHGMYELPGGKLEENESPEDAAKIEALEESGLPIVNLEALDPHVDHNMEKIYHGFTAEVDPDHEGDVIRSDEHDNHMWIHPEDALDMQGHPDGMDVPFLSHHAEHLFSQLIETGEPMDLSWRLLKAVMPGTAGFPEDEHNTDNIIAIQEQAYKLAELNTPWDKERWPNYEDWQEAIEMDGEGILAQMMHEPEYAHLRELYSQHSQPPENYGELQLPFKERDDIHNFYRNQGIPLPGEPIHIPGIGELPPVPSKVTMHEVDDHPQWPTGTLYDDKSGFTTGEPMDLSWRLLKFRLPMKTNHRSVLPKPNMSRQTTLPEFAPNMPSPHGDVKWFHGTSGDRVGSIQTEGLKPNQGKVWVTGNRDVAENYAGGRSANRYIEEVMQPGGDLASPTQNPVTFGIREGAGSPKRHMGMESFDNTIKPEQLVRMPPTQKPANPAWHTGKSETGPSTGAQGQ